MLNVVTPIVMSVLSLLVGLLVNSITKLNGDLVDARLDVRELLVTIEDNEVSIIAIEARLFEHEEKHGE